MGYLRDKIILIIAKETIVIVLINMSRRYPVQLSLVLLAGGFMKLIAIYCRTSTLIQKSGLESQKRSLIEYCKQNNIDNYVIYEDEGISGTKKERPGLNKLMSEVKKGNVSKVIVYSFSRFARSTAHLLEALEIFKKTETEFISRTENFDTNSPMGRAFYTVIAAISQLERDLISERVKSGLVNAKAKGKILGRPKTRNTNLIKSLRRKGYTYQQIRELLGVGHGTITRAIRDTDTNDTDD